MLLAIINYAFLWINAKLQLYTLQYPVAAGIIHMCNWTQCVTQPVADLQSPLSLFKNTFHILKAENNTGSLPPTQKEEISILALPNVEFPRSSTVKLDPSLTPVLTQKVMSRFRVRRLHLL